MQTSNPIADVEALRERIFVRLRQFHPTAFGHIQQVHRDKWLAAYLFMPHSAPAKDFADMRSEADAIVREVWPETACRPTNSTGRDSEGCHYYVLWLPVPPNRSSRDFEHFFPTGRNGTSP